MQQEPGEDDAGRMDAELERGDDAEVAPAAAESPEEIGVLLRVHPDELPVGGDDVCGDEVVARQAVLAREPAETATEGQAGDAGGRHEPSGGGEPERLEIVV